MGRIYQYFDLGKEKMINQDISSFLRTNEIQFLVNETIRRECQLNPKIRKVKKNHWRETSNQLTQLYSSLNEILEEISDCVSFETRMGLCPEGEPLNIMADIFPLINETRWYKIRKNSIELSFGNF